MDPHRAPHLTRAPLALAPEPEPDPWVGRTVGDGFEIVEQIGVGPHTTTYRARQRPFDRPVTLEILWGRALTDADLRARFLREARVLSRLTAPGVVRALRFGCALLEGGRVGGLYLAREPLPGRSLREVLEAEGALAPERAARIARQILGALADAHTHGVVHRDVRPPHIRLGVDALGGEQAALAGFGRARVLDEAPEWPGPDRTLADVLVGSPRYAAPETLCGRPAEAAADLYAVGVVLYEMLTGEQPFVGAFNAVMRARLRRDVPPVPAGLDPTGALDAVIRRATARDPAERHPDAAAMAADLDRALARHAARRPTLSLVSSGEATLPIVPRVAPTRRRPTLLGAPQRSASAAAALLLR